MTLDIETVQIAGDWDQAIDWANLADRAAHAAIAVTPYAALTCGPRNVELCVRLTDARESRQLNAQWRGKDYPTNILSFPLMSATDLRAQGEMTPCLMGDLLLADSVIMQESQTQNKAINAHFTHLVAHGVLHLLGYDHEKEEEAHTMENLERRIMNTLGMPDPYAQTPHAAMQEGTP